MKKIEKASIVKAAQLALFREYGFQPNLKDIEILATADFPDFPGHVETVHTVVKGHFYNIFFDVYGTATVQKF